MPLIHYLLESSFSCPVHQPFLFTLTFLPSPVIMGMEENRQKGDECSEILIF